MKFKCHSCKEHKTKSYFHKSAANIHRGLTANWCVKCARAKAKAKRQAITHSKTTCGLPVRERIKDPKCPLRIENQMSVVSWS